MNNEQKLPKSCFRGESTLSSVISIIIVVQIGKKIKIYLRIAMLLEVYALEKMYKSLPFRLQVDTV
jgi:hypothetical protein